MARKRDGHLFHEQAVAGRAAPGDGWAATPKPKPAKPSTSDIRGFEVHAEAILDAIVHWELDDLESLCADPASPEGAARRFTVPEILALVDAVSGAYQRTDGRARKAKSALAAGSVSVRWEKVEQLRQYARNLHDERKWRSATHAAASLLPAVRIERDRLESATPKDSNAADWLVDLLRAHRRTKNT